MDEGYHSCWLLLPATSLFTFLKRKYWVILVFFFTKLTSPAFLILPLFFYSLPFLCFPVSTYLCFSQEKEKNIELPCVPPQFLLPHKRRPALSFSFLLFCVFSSPLMPMAQPPGAPSPPLDSIKPSSCNLYVNSLPKEVTDDKLVQMFSTFGDIESARVMVDLGTRVSKGYGFVKFRSAESGMNFTCIPLLKLEDTGDILWWVLP